MAFVCIQAGPSLEDWQRTCFIVFMKEVPSKAKTAKLADNSKASTRVRALEIQRQLKTVSGCDPVRSNVRRPKAGKGI